MYPGRYEETYGIKPGSLSRHCLPGTSFQGIDFPHIRLAFQDERLVDETILVSDAKTDREYRELHNLTLTENLPHWDDHNIPYGRTTRAGLAVALAKAKKVQDQNFVVLAYDKPDRYDS
jgi:cysteine synthase